MRLLISSTEKNIKDVAYLIPWENDSACFNFQAPTKIVLQNAVISRPKKIETLVIDCDLQNYDFVGSMANLSQLYIYKGNHINDLSFVKNLTRLTQLCILNSHIESLDPLVELIDLKYELYKEFPEDQELIGRDTYGFEGVCIRSDSYSGDGRELIHGDICRNEILVNDSKITFEDIFVNPEYRKLLHKDG